MTYKEEFIKFMAASGVLKFGDFTLKSGRKSPYFMNAGNYNTGEALARLGGYYAECIKNSGVAADLFFGPAYKGIPLAVTAAAAYYTKFGRNVNYCFDRKEEKDHGEGGVFVGKIPADGDNVVIIDDVATSGKALRESLPKLYSAAKVNITAFVITVDRKEKGIDSELSAVEQIQKEFSIPVFAIVTIDDIIKALEDGIVEGKEYLGAIRNYRATYGVK